MKPKSGGAPAIDMVAATATANVIGMDRQRPPSSVMSRVPVRMSISPTTKNSAALKKACANRIETPANTAYGVPSELRSHRCEREHRDPLESRVRARVRHRIVRRQEVADFADGEQAVISRIRSGNPVEHIHVFG